MADPTGAWLRRKRHAPADRYQNGMESMNLFGLYVGRKATDPLCTSSGCTSGTFTCGGGGGYLME